MSKQPYITITRDDLLSLAPCGMTAAVVYLYLKSRANEDGTCWPSIATICTDLCVDRKRVFKALDKLVEAGFLDVQKSVGRSNQYRINQCPKRDRSQNDTSPKTGTTPVPKTGLHQSRNGHTKKNTRRSLQEETTCARALRFDEFWTIYPARKGRKLGKEATKNLFTKLSDDDQILAIAAARSYAADDCFKKDPERFLKANYWRDWLDGSPSGNGSHQDATEKYKQQLGIA